MGINFGSWGRAAAGCITYKGIAKGKNVADRDDSGQGKPILCIRLSVGVCATADLLIVDMQEPGGV